jgi:hypothetical protein
VKVFKKSRAGAGVQPGAGRAPAPAAPAPAGLMKMVMIGVGGDQELRVVGWIVAPRGPVPVVVTTAS